MHWLYTLSAWTVMFVQLIALVEGCAMFWEGGLFFCRYSNFAAIFTIAASYALLTESDMFGSLFVMAFVSSIIASIVYWFFLRPNSDSKLQKINFYLVSVHGFNVLFLFIIVFNDSDILGAPENWLLSLGFHLAFLIFLLFVRETYFYNYFNRASHMHVHGFERPVENIN
jgi:hypothetical protein